MERESQATWDVRGTDQYLLGKRLQQEECISACTDVTSQRAGNVVRCLEWKAGEVNPEIRFDHYIIQRDCTVAKTKNVLDKLIKSDTFTKSGALSSCILGFVPGAEF
jgi:hypothetical protein